MPSIYVVFCVILHQIHVDMVSFIILNYNTPQLTKDCVDSIEKYYGDKEHEVVIVDNNSKKESLLTSSLRHPKLFIE